MVPQCIRCYDDFPVDKEQTYPNIRMGFLYRADSFPDEEVKNLLTSHPEDDFICGNCYFDLTD